MIKEFKEFILRGNVLDLAVAVIIGGAFGKIVTSFVNDIIMPPIGLLLGQMDFAKLFIDLSGKGFTTLAAAQEAGAPTINYGIFISAIIDFVIISLVIFLVLKAVSKMKKPVQATAPTTKACPYCCTDIPIPATRCPHCTSELK